MSAPVSRRDVRAMLHVVRQRERLPVLAAGMLDRPRRLRVLAAARLLAALGDVTGPARESTSTGCCGPSSTLRVGWQHLATVRTTGVADVDVALELVRDAPMHLSLTESWIEAVDQWHRQKRYATWNALRQAAGAVAEPVADWIAQLTSRSPLTSPRDLQWHALATGVLLTRALGSIRVRLAQGRLPIALDDITAVGLTDRHLLDWSQTDQKPDVRWSNLVSRHAGHLSKLFQGARQACHDKDDRTRSRALAVLISTHEGWLQQTVRQADSLLGHRLLPDRRIKLRGLLNAVALLARRA